MAVKKCVRASMRVCMCIRETCVHDVCGSLSLPLMAR